MKRWTVAVGVALALALLTLPTVPGVTISSFSLFGGEVAAASCEADAKPAPLDYILKDMNGNDVDLATFKGNVILLNFWATWCAPCKKEMPSLDQFYQNNNFNNLVVFAVNTEQPNTSKTKKFFTDLNIQKLEIFFDRNLNFVKELKLRGVPTTVLINNKGEEFARIIGSIDFQDKKFLKWLSNYD